MMYKKAGSAVGRISTATPPSGGGKEPLRLIGAKVATGATIVVSAWEPMKAGDIVVLFATRQTAGSITAPAGFTQFNAAVNGTTTNAGFSGVIGSAGATPTVTATGAQFVSVLIYRGGFGIGVSANFTGTAQATQSISLTGASAGSLVAAAPHADAVSSTDSVLALGFCVPGGIRGSSYAATSLGGLAGASNPTLQFTLLSSQIRALVAVEILSK